MVDGEVRKVDKEAGKLTLRHGPIAHLDMGAMSMVFRVTDPKMLDQFKEGDKVRFMADKVNGLYNGDADGSWQVVDHQRVAPLFVALRLKSLTAFGRHDSFQALTAMGRGRVQTPRTLGNDGGPSGREAW